MTTTETKIDAASAKAAHDDAWLTERLGEVSPAIRRIVRRAVLEGDWWLSDANWYLVELTRCADDGTELQLRLWHSGGRFTNARLRRITTEADARTIAETESWVSS